VLPVHFFDGNGDNHPESILIRRVENSKGSFSGVFFYLTGRVCIGTRELLTK
jgi:hypothetical protein